nr:hypothetical protein [Bacilli bacterium]
MSDEQAKFVLNLLHEHYPNAKLRPETATLYLMYLAAMPFEVGMNTAMKVATESKFFRPLPISCKGR